MSDIQNKTKIEVKNLTKKFGELLVLDNINFTVGNGELLCIVGPTGCGKTTFLNLLSNLLEPTDGNIFIDNEHIQPKKHNIAFVFQESSSLPWRTVKQNITYGMEIKKRFSKAEIDSKATELMELVGLKELTNHYPRDISASMEQRVAIARAFAVNPDLLLMDEPYGQLDVKLRYYLEDELIKIWQKYRNTVIFVTHNIEEAVYLGERTLVLSNKPTTVKTEIKVNLPRPRNFLDPEFIKIVREITQLIKWW
ncbi:MAG: ABC transporter ATP-binding protein [Atribacterota bacterium]|nr:ABC transporter ATP-binding protein [Atribacterota bacterium]MDD4896786.1 ABC transporter ATP-binding protein [Atribacterota bacterium]MDD5637453.1 ABC transporter ATP-binding protein [Atribacterota bacterium]